MYLGGMAMGNRVDQWIKVEGRKIWVLGLDVHHTRGVVPWQMHVIRERVVEIREGYAVLRTNWLPYDDLVNVIELIPVFVTDKLLVLYKRLKLGTTRNCQVQSFGCEERLEIK
jgi:hypothetical protein